MSFKSYLQTAAFVLIAFVSLSIKAAPVIPSDYMIAGNIGDTWTYSNLDNSQFTWTLSEVISGPFAGFLERGNTDSGMVYELVNKILTIHELNKSPVIPPLVIGEIELGQVVTLNDDPINPSQYLFWKVPSVTVQAGTFNDVLAWVFLDDNFGANAANLLLGLDPLLASAVTDFELFAQGIGQLSYVGVDAATGSSDGLGFELISTTVPVPAAAWLFGSGLVGLIGFARRRSLLSK